MAIITRGFAKPLEVGPIESTNLDLQRSKALPSRRRAAPEPGRPVDRLLHGRRLSPPRLLQLSHRKGSQRSRSIPSGPMRELHRATHWASRHSYLLARSTRCPTIPGLRRSTLDSGLASTPTVLSPQSEAAPNRCRFAAGAKSPSARHACRPRARPTCLVLRCGQGGDDRRSGALFGARGGALNRCRVEDG